MNVLSLFDGMSCGQIALERAGIKVDNYKNLKRVKKRYGKLPLGTIIFNDKTFTINENIRNFNQIELERLHNIPEGYTKILNVNKAHDLIGDGWTVDIIVHIFSYLK